MHIVRHTHIKFTRIWWGYVTRVREAHKIYIHREKRSLIQTGKKFSRDVKSRFFCFPHSGRNETHTRVNNRNFVLYTHLLLPTPHYFLTEWLSSLSFNSRLLIGHIEQPMYSFSISADLSLLFCLSHTHFFLKILIRDY